jgi:replicative DNA helicase
MNGRVPPQNIEAEMAVLGSMLLGDSGAIERVTEFLDKQDFYREAHGRIYEAMLALVDKVEPVDIVTLKDELTRRGSLEQVGGYLYLMQLAEYVPTPANIVYYAKIVSEKGVLRRLIETASEIAGMAYGEIEEVDTLVDQAERAIFNVARKRKTEGFTPLRPLLSDVFEQIDTAYHDKGVVSGTDTGFYDLNYITSGLKRGDLIIIAARPSMGKCLTARTLVDDPLTGERLTIEEAVRRKMPRITGVSECGRIRPTAISDWIDSGIKPAFRVTTKTGRFVEVTGHHPFLTNNGWQPLHDLSVGDGIAVSRWHPIVGSPDFEVLDSSISDLVEALRSGERSLLQRLWGLGTKDVMIYLEQMVFKSSEFCTPDEEIARGIQHALLRGRVVTELSQTESGWKLTRFTPEPGPWPDLFLDEIISIESIGEQHVYDLTVPDGANFVAQDIIVHNTALTMNIGQNAAGKGSVVATFSLEMSKESLVQRMMCSEAKVNAHKLRTGFLQDEEWSRLSEAVNRLWDAPMFIDDTTDMSSLEMRARCRRLKAEQGSLDLVIVDYLQLMRGSAKSSENRNQEISEIARGLKSLARELDVPVIALSQLSRSVERREDKRPMLSDLRESGAIEAEADLVAFIYRPSYYARKDAVTQDGEEKAEQEGGEYEGEEAEIIIAKQRNGPTGTVKLAFLPKFASFANLAQNMDGPDF